MAAHASLKNEFKENEKCHYLMSWLNYYHSLSLFMSGNYKCNTAYVLQQIRNPFFFFLPIGLNHPYQLDEFISSLSGAWCTFFIFILFLIEIPVSKHKKDDKLIWVKQVCIFKTKNALIESKGPENIICTMIKYGKTF